MLIAQFLTVTVDEAEQPTLLTPFEHAEITFDPNVQLLSARSRPGCTLALGIRQP